MDDTFALFSQACSPLHFKIRTEIKLKEASRPITSNCLGDEAASGSHLTKQRPSRGLWC